MELEPELSIPQLRDHNFFAGWGDVAEALALLTTEFHQVFREGFGRCGPSSLLMF